MPEKINGRKPEEIKYALGCYANRKACSGDTNYCPYFWQEEDCEALIARDALDLIAHLESRSKRHAMKARSKEEEKQMMTLKDTAGLMSSPDYKERFAAEYYQTKIRYEKLHAMIVRYEAGTLDFVPDCSIGLLKQQKASMGQYLYALEVRAQVEHIDLKDAERK